MHWRHPDGLRPRGVRQGPAGLPAGWLAIFTLASPLFLLPGPARAQCAPPNPGDPLIVVCSGSDPDGFDAGADDGVQVTVRENATVSNGANTDSIRLNNRGVVVIELSGSVTNDAVGGAAVSVLDGEQVGQVSHSGSITVSGDGGIGIRGQDRNFLAVTQPGSISLEAPNSVGIQARDNNTSVANDGTITGSATGSVGIRVGTNNGVFGMGAIDLGGDDAIGVELGGDNALSVRGSIEVSGANAVGVLAGVGGTENNTISNSGLIGLGAAGGVAVSFAPSGPGGTNVLDTFAGSTIDGASGIAVLGSAAIENFFHAGSIIGSVDLAGGSDTLILVGDLDDVDLGSEDDSLELSPRATFVSVTGGLGIDSVRLLGGAAGSLDLAAIADFESLELTGGNWTLQGSGTFGNGITLTSGTLRIADPVALTGNLSLDADAMAGTAGRLTVSDTLDLSGDYTQAGGSTLLAILDPAGPSGAVTISGTGTLENGAILEIVPATPFGASESFTILTASLGFTPMNDSFSVAPVDTAVLTYDLNTVDLGGPQAIVLDVMRSPYAGAASTANQRAVGSALDGVLAAGPSGDMQQLLASLDQVSAGSYGAALDTLHTEVYDAQTSTSFWLGHSFANLAARQLLECEPTYFRHLPEWITSGPPCNEDGWTPRMGAFGSFLSRDRGSGHIDFEAQGGGFAVGAGRSLGPDWELALYMGGGFSWLDVAQVGEGTLQSLDVGMAVMRRIGPLQLRSVLDYAHGWHEQDRNSMVGGFQGRATGEFESNRVTGLLEVSYDLEDASGLALEPVGSVDFSWLDQEGFTESGGMGANLAVEERSHTVVGTTLGLRFGATWVKHRYLTDRLQWANGVWRPRLDVRWRGNWTGVERDLTGRFTAAPAGTGLFTAQSEDTEHGADISVGTTWQPYKSRVLLSAGYRGFIGDGTQVHSVGADIRVPF